MQKQPTTQPIWKRSRVLAATFGMLTKATIIGLTLALIGAATLAVPTAAQSSTELSPPDAEPKPEPRITGGSIVTTLNGIDFVSTVWTGYDNCTGSLVAAEWILTAAHCLDDTTASEVSVRLNIIDEYDFDNEIFRYASRIILHPDWDSSAYGGPNDIALIQIDPVYDIEPIAIATAADAALWAAGSTATALGWGQSDEAFSPDGKLRTATLALLGDDCPAEVDMQLHICTGATDDGITTGNICYGDSGGPLFVRRADGTPVQIGLPAWLIYSSCDSPTLHTNLSYFEAWWEPYITSNATPEQRELFTARTNWANRFWPDYTMSFSFCIDDICVDRTVTVEDDQVTTSTRNPRLSFVDFTVDQIFDHLEAEMTTEGSVIESVEYGAGTYPGPTRYRIATPEATTSFTLTDFSYNLPDVTPEDIAKIDEAQATWSTTASNDYRFAYEYCTEEAALCDTYETTVVDGDAIASFNYYSVDPPVVRTVDDLFRELRVAIATNTGFEYLYFNEDNGVPEYFTIFSEPKPLTFSLWFYMPIFPPTPELRQLVDDARTTWEQQRFESYTITFEYCQVTFEQDCRIGSTTVLNGEVTSTANYSAYPEATPDGWFEELEWAMDDGRGIEEVTFGTGVYQGPTSFVIPGQSGSETLTVLSFDVLDEAGHGDMHA